MTDNHNKSMQTNNQSTEGKDPQQTKDESSLDGATCSASFTPGPWVIGDENNQHIEICIGDAVANLDRQDRYGLHMAFSRDEMRANGRLIAAAPDMLDALIKMHEAGKEGGVNEGDWYMCLLSETITKAIGSDWQNETSAATGGERNDHE